MMLTKEKGKNMKLCKKKAIALILLVVVLVAAVVLLHNSAAKNIDFSPDTVQEDLKEIYGFWEGKSTPHLQGSYSEDVMNYINSKAHAYRKIEPETMEKNDIEVNVKLLDKKETKGYLKLLYGVEVKFIYVKSGNSTDEGNPEYSGYGTEVLVTLNKQSNYEVIDMVESMNWFDDMIRDTSIMPYDLREMMNSNEGSTMPSEDKIKIHMGFS